MRGKWGLHLALVGANAYLAIKHVNAHVYVNEKSTRIQGQTVAELRC
jgi:hypothetical protein